MVAATEIYSSLAAYNAWANERLYAAAAALTDEQLRADRGAFFRSVFGTLNHLLVTDHLWMARLDGESPQHVALDAILYEGFDALHAARRAQDQALIARIGAYRDSDLGRNLAYRTSKGQPQSQPLWQVLSHLFNHQTHHRGQIHDLLHQINGRAPPLDLLMFQRQGPSRPAET